MFLVQNSTTKTFKSLALASRTLSPVDSLYCFISSFLIFHDLCHHSSLEPHHFSPGQWYQSPDSCLLSWHGTLLLSTIIMVLCSRCCLVERCGHITFPGQWNLSRDKGRRKQCLLISLLWWSNRYVFLDCGVCTHGVPTRMWWSRGPANVMWTWTEKRNKLCLLKLLKFEFCLVVLLFSLTWLIYIESLPLPIIFVHSCQGNLFKSQARLFPNQKSSAARHYLQIRNLHFSLSRNLKLCP